MLTGRLGRRVQLRPRTNSTAPADTEIGPVTGHATLDSRHHRPSTASLVRRARARRACEGRAPSAELERGLSAELERGLRAELGRGSSAELKRGPSAELGRGLSAELERGLTIGGLSQRRAGGLRCCKRAGLSGSLVGSASDCGESR